jgi:hypothetical protein
MWVERGAAIPRLVVEVSTGVMVEGPSALVITGVVSALVLTDYRSCVSVRKAFGQR